MRLPFLPPPSPEALEQAPVHELIRDFPELSVLVPAEEGREGESGYRTFPPSQRGRAGELLAWREGLPG